MDKGHIAYLFFKVSRSLSKNKAFSLFYLSSIFFGLLIPICRCLSKYLGVNDLSYTKTSPAAKAKYDYSPGRRYPVGRNYTCYHHRAFSIYRR